MRLSALSLAAAALGTAACAQPSETTFTYGDRNTDFMPAFENQTRAPLQNSGYEYQTEVIAGGLEHPWGIAPLPEGGYLVTERAGRLRHVGPDGALSEPIAGVPEVLARDQGGLLDVALGPDFAADRMVYLTYSKPMGDVMSATAAARGRLSQDMTAIEGVEDIFVQEPPSPTAQALRLAARLRRAGPRLHHHGRAFEPGRARPRPGPRQDLRQGGAPQPRRLGARKTTRSSGRTARSRRSGPTGTATSRPPSSPPRASCSRSSTGRRAATSSTAPSRG